MLNYSKFLTTEARQREPPYLIKLRSTTGGSKPCVYLGGGIPCPDILPFKEATFTLKNGEVLHLSQKVLEEGMQYGPFMGKPALIEQLRDLTTKLHNPPHMDQRGLIVTGGANQGIYLCVHTFLEAGDYIFVPDYTYPNLFNILEAVKANVVSIPTDSQGIRPDLLEEALSRTPAERRKLLYVIPNADNPTGTTMSEARRREVYETVCKYDILLVEDDAYYFLQYGTKVPPPTFLSLDTEGRVIRIDTVAKTVGPGIRTGYITADKPFTDKLAHLVSHIMGHAPMLSQVLLSELLRHWGTDRFLEFTSQGREAYKEKRDAMLRAATKHLSGLCEWKDLDGMFLWLKVHGLDDVWHLVEEECFKNDLIVVPGNPFTTDVANPCPYIRLSFSTATPEMMDTGLQVLAECIRRELKTKGQINGHNSDDKEAK